MIARPLQDFSQKDEAALRYHDANVRPADRVDPITERQAHPAFQVELVLRA